MPAPHTTATPQPRSVPARRIANVSLRTVVRAAQPRAATASCSVALLAGQVGAGEQDVADLGDRLLRPAGRRRQRLGEQVLEHVAGSRRAPMWCGELSRPARQRQHHAVGAHEREVGLGVAAVDGEDDGRGHGRAPAVATEQSLEERLDHAPLPDQRMGEERRRATLRLPVTAASTASRS